MAVAATLTDKCSQNCIPKGEKSGSFNPDIGMEIYSWSLLSSMYLIMQLASSNAKDSS